MDDLRNTTRYKSRRLALCGVLSALAVTVMMLGSIVPFATFCCPILAMVVMVPVVVEYDTKTALLFYAAVSVLSVLLAPDKEAALIFVFLGYYPAIREKLNGRMASRFWRTAAKLGLFLVSVVAMYTLAIWLFRMGDLAAEYHTTSAMVLCAMVLLGCVLFLLCDTVLARMTALYRHRLRKKWFRA